MSPYCSMGNNPIVMVDPTGKVPIITITPTKGGGGTILISANVWLTGVSAENIKAAQGLVNQVYTSGNYTDEEKGVWVIEFDIKVQAVNPDVNPPIGGNNSLVYMDVADGRCGVMTGEKNKNGTKIGTMGRLYKHENIVYVITHEIGHFLGLWDTYKDIPIEGCKPDPESAVPKNLQCKTSVPISEQYKDDVMCGGEKLNSSHFEDLGKEIFKEAKNYTANDGQTIFELEYMVGKNPTTSKAPSNNSNTSCSHSTTLGSECSTKLEP